MRKHLLTQPGAAVFVANADGSLVMATHPMIASEFNELESSSWLYTAFTLAGASTQVLIGKLSDIFGRILFFLFCFFGFVFGCFVLLWVCSWMVCISADACLHDYYDSRTDLN